MGYRKRLGALRRWLLRLPLLAAALSCYGQFGGPGGFGGSGGFGDIQSAGSGRTAGGNRMTLRPWISVNGNYGQNAPFFEDGMQTGNSDDFFGASAAAGLSGGKAWSRTSLAGMATGSYNFYNSDSPYRGGNVSGAIGLSHMFSKSLGIAVSEMAGSTFGGLGYGGWNGYGNYGSAAMQAFQVFENGNPAFGDPNLNGVVSQEVFGNRVTYSGTSGTLRYQPSRRWTTGAGGSYYVVKREGQSLSDSQSLSGTAMVSYRLNRRSYLGGGYVYSRFTYPQIFGDTNAQQVYLQYTVMFNDRSRLNVWGGGALIRGEAIGTIALDPALAELLGQPTQQVVANVRATSGVGGATYNYSWRWANFGAGFTRGVSPGNGALYTSIYDSAYAALSRSLGDRMSIGATANWYRSNDVIVAGSHAEGRSASAAWGWMIGKGFNFTLSGGFQTSILPNGRGRGAIATAGINWSPSNEPFRF
jgi:hypothetical protein